MPDDGLLDDLLDQPSSSKGGGLLDDLVDSTLAFTNHPTGVTLRHRDNAVWIPSLQGWFNKDASGKVFKVDEAGKPVASLAYVRKSAPERDITPDEAKAFESFKGPLGDIDTTGNWEATKLSAGALGNYTKRVAQDLNPKDINARLGQGLTGLGSSILDTANHVANIPERALTELGVLPGSAAPDQATPVGQLAEGLHRASQDWGAQATNQDPTIVGQTVQMAPALLAAKGNPRVGGLAFGSDFSSNLRREAREAGASPAAQEGAGLLGLGLGGAFGALRPGAAAAPETAGKVTAAQRIAQGGKTGLALGGVKAAENAYAKTTYDPNRSLVQGVPESVAMGSALGAMEATPETEPRYRPELAGKEVPKTREAVPAGSKRVISSALKDTNLPPEERIRMVRERLGLDKAPAKAEEPLPEASTPTEEGIPADNVSRNPNYPMPEADEGPVRTEEPAPSDADLNAAFEEKPAPVPDRKAVQDRQDVLNRQAEQILGEMETARQQHDQFASKYAAVLARGEMQGASAAERSRANQAKELIRQSEKRMNATLKRMGKPLEDIRAEMDGLSEQLRNLPQPQEEIPNAAQEGVQPQSRKPKREKADGRGQTPEAGSGDQPEQSGQVEQGEQGQEVAAGPGPESAPAVENQEPVSFQIGQGKKGEKVTLADPDLIQRWTDAKAKHDAAMAKLDDLRDVTSPEARAKMRQEIGASLAQEKQAIKQAITTPEERVPAGLTDARAGERGALNIGDIADAAKDLAERTGKSFIDSIRAVGGNRAVEEHRDALKRMGYLQEDYKTGSHEVPELARSQVGGFAPKVEKDMPAVDGLKATGSKFLSPSMRERGHFAEGQGLSTDLEAAHNHAFSVAHELKRAQKDVFKGVKDDRYKVMETMKPVFERFQKVITDFQPMAREMKRLQADVDQAVEGVRGAEDGAPKAKAQRILAEATEKLQEYRDSHGALMDKLQGELDKVLADKQKAKRELAHKSKDAAIYMAAEMPKESVPVWLRAALGKDGLQKADFARDLFNVKARKALQDVGIPTIDEVYAPHLIKQFDPEYFNATQEIGAGAPDTIREVLAFAHRAENAQDSWMPSAQAAMDAYIPSLARKLAYQPVLAKWEPMVKPDTIGGYLDKASDKYAPNTAAYVADRLKLIQDTAKPGALDKVVNGLRTYNYLTSVGLSARTAVKHAAKFTNLISEHGIYNIPGARDYAHALTGKTMEALERSEPIRNAMKAVGLSDSEFARNAKAKAEVMDHYLKTKAVFDLVEENNILSDPKMSDLAKTWGVEAEKELQRVKSGAKHIAAMPTSVMEHFENGLNIMATLAHAKSAGLSSEMAGRAVLQNILNYNYRGGHDAPDVLTMRGNRGAGARALTQYQMTPTKLVETQYRILVDGLKGKKDIYGGSATSRLVRHAVVLGALSQAAPWAVKNLAHLPYVDNEKVGDWLQGVWAKMTGDDDEAEHKFAEAASRDAFSSDLPWKKGWKDAQTVGVGGVEAIPTTVSAYNQLLGEVPDGYDSRMDYIKGTKNEEGESRSGGLAVRKQRREERSIRRGLLRKGIEE